MMTNRNIEQQGRALLRESVRQIRRTETTKARRIYAGSLAMLMAGVQIMPAFAAITNTVTANGTGPGGAPVSGTGNASVGVQVAAPGISLIKTASLADGASGVANKGDPGEVITYTYQVKNTGNVTLKNVSLVDLQSGASATGLVFAAPAVTTDVAPANDSTNANTNHQKWDVLAPGDVVTFKSTYTIVQADINGNGGIAPGGTTSDGSLHNTATITANYINTNASTTTPVTDTKSAAVPLDIVSGLQVVKTASPSSNVKVGDTVTYTFTVTNNGGTDVTNINLVDTFHGAGTPPTPAFQSFTTDPGSLSTHSGNTITLLKAGSVAIYTATYVVTQADVDAQ